MEEFSYGVIPILKETKEVLLVESINHEWGFPKGHKELSDTSDESCALRELFEETGVSDCSLIPGKNYEISYQITNNGTECNKTVRFFLGLVKTRRLTPAQGEILRVDWFDYDVATARLSFKDTKTVLHRAYKELGSLDNY